jgi:hypothetical protein
MALAYDRDPDVLEQASDDKAEKGTAARLAAEKIRPAFEQLGASKAQAAALVEAVRLVLIGDEPRARDVLTRAEFSPDEVDRIFPKLISGLRQAA